VFGVGEGVEGDAVGGLGGDMAAHFDGDEGIRFTVDEKDLDGRLPDRLADLTAVQIDASKEAGAEGEKGHREAGRDMVILAADLGDDLFGRREGTIGDDVAHVIGKSHTGREKDGGSTHRHPDEGNSDILAEAVFEIVDPREHVAAFLDAEGDDMTLTVTASALIDEEKIIAVFHEKRTSSAEITDRSAAVSVTADGNRRAVLDVYIPCRKRKRVKRGRSDAFIGNFAEGLYHCLHSPAAFGREVVKGNIENIVLLVIGGMKGNAVGDIGERQRQKGGKQKSTRKNIQNGHGYLR